MLMNTLLRISRGIDVINTWIGRSTAWLILLAILVSAINATIRKVFGTSSNAWLELQWLLFGAVFLLCASWTLIQNEHIRIDILGAIFPRRLRSSIEFLGHTLFLLPMAAVMAYLSWPFFVRSFESNEQSGNAGGLVIWPGKLLILLGFAALFAQGISEVIKRIGVATGRIPDPLDAVAPHGAAEAEAERLLKAVQEGGIEPAAPVSTDKR
jgi:TRAP-type mannitol/chloroaromatic compound transport system permease small subunit